MYTLYFIPERLSLRRESVKIREISKDELMLKKRPSDNLESLL